MDLRPPLDLRTLYYFTILAEEKHFGLAAKRIGIEQPPLSLQIKKLEEKVGGKLFDRSNKRVRLTPSGEALLPEARQLLANTYQLLDKIKKINSGEAGTLQIGFTSSTIFCGLPAFIQHHKQAFPEVGFSLRERSPTIQIQELLEGTLDIGFIREPEKVEGLTTREVVKENYVAVLSNKHPLAQKEILNLKDLKAELFVLFPKNIAPNQFEKLNGIFKAAAFYPSIVQEAYEWQTIVNLVEANLGVSICPSSFQKMKIGDIKYIPLADVKAQTGVSACFNSDNHSALLRNFLQSILQDVNSIS
ncbi:LysR substrate-binding domain-containing protein [Pontibacter toksunensis]|uniref:LysR substrate-binding domain-containing protein n=1 Tax=Pontibacter toksunensis TaxID=1332631 RepID=A0ABW6BZ13_9BACT